MNAAIHPLLHDLKPRRMSSKVLYTIGAFWVFVALLHTVVLAGTGFEWAGSVSWRKPITFGLSVGMLLATVGWILDRLPNRPRRAGAIAWILGAASTVEVGLITLQAWRGEASHFNSFDETNARIFSSMAVMVGIMSLCLIAVLVWAAISRPVDPLVSRATLAGMALVVAGLGIGQWLVSLGNDFAAANGIVPDVVTNGVAGTPKFPHAIAFHGIQVFIVAALALRRSHVPERIRMRIMGALIASYSAVLVFAAMQSILGTAPTDVSAVTGLMAISTLATLAILVNVFRRYVTTLPMSLQRDDAEEEPVAPPMASSIPPRVS